MNRFEKMKVNAEKLAKRVKILEDKWFEVVGLDDPTPSIINHPMLNSGASVNKISDISREITPNLLHNAIWKQSLVEMGQVMINTSQHYTLVFQNDHIWLLSLKRRGVAQILLPQFKNLKDFMMHVIKIPNKEFYAKCIDFVG